MLLKLNLLIMLAHAASCLMWQGHGNHYVADFFSNLAQLDKFEMTFIANGKTSLRDKELQLSLQRLQETDMGAVFTYDLSLLMTDIEKHHKDNCPILVPYSNVSATHKNSLYQREIRAIPDSVRPRLITFWIDEHLLESDVLMFLHQVTLNCSQSIDYGPFQKDSIILFLTQELESVENILLNKNLPLFNHPQTLGVVRTPGHPLMSVWQRVPYKGVEELQQNFFWTPKNLLTSIDDFIPPLQSFNGEHIIVSTVNFNQPVDSNGFIPKNSWTPAYHHIIARDLETLTAEVSLKPALAKDIRLIDETGNFLGQSQLIYLNLVDVAIHGFEDHNQQIGDLSTVLLNPYRFTSFIAPKPKQISKNFVLIYPYTLEVWIALAVGSLISALGFMVVYYLQGKRLQVDPIRSSKQQATWFVVATLLRNDNAFFQSHMLQTKQGRILTLLWLFFCFLMSSGYSGNLYSFLANPLYEEPINDLAGILNSGLPWMWYRDNPAIEFLVSQSTNPELQKIWEGHQPLRREDGPTLHKVMEPVARGEYILISSSNLRLMTDIIFTPDNGDPLVHYPGKPLADITVSKFSWFFPKVSRWGKLISKFIRTSVEIGLPSKWAKTSNDRYNVIYTRLYEARGLIYTGDDQSKRDLTFQLSDVQGTFLLWLGMSVGSIFIFVLEKMSKIKKAAPAK